MLASRKNLSSDEGDSGSKKFKRGYDDDCGGSGEVGIWLKHRAWSKAVSFVLMRLAGTWLMLL